MIAAVRELFEHDTIDCALRKIETQLPAPHRYEVRARRYLRRGKILGHFAAALVLEAALEGLTKLDRAMHEDVSESGGEG